MLKIVNMIPASLSGETNQDSEPNLAVNPAKPTDMVATAFTPAPMGGAFAPIYVSTDGGTTWSLRTVVPGNGASGTGDISVAFATTGGRLYAGILSGTTGRLQILRTANFTATTPMTSLVDRDSEDQPWVVAGSVVVAGTSRDRVFVGNNDFAQPGGRTATVDLSANAATAAGARRLRAAPDRAARHRGPGRAAGAGRPPPGRHRVRGVPALGHRERPQRHARRRRHARRQLGHRREPVLGPRRPGRRQGGQARRHRPLRALQRDDGSGAPGRRPRDRGGPGELEDRLAGLVRPRRRRLRDRLDGARAPIDRPGRDLVRGRAHDHQRQEPGPRDQLDRAPSASPTSSSRPLGG